MLHLLDDGLHLLIFSDHAALPDLPSFVVDLVHALNANYPHGDAFPVFSLLVVVDEKVLVVEELLAVATRLVELT